ncbi:MAG: (Fe-S)-binding protein [Deltaproteobacteria bacterium]|nr:(Fe-S)-binding protein [Deltaproteobacteria bacterium]
MEEQLVEQEIEKYLNENLIWCEKCHFCNTVCPIVESRVSQGSFGINRAIYYGLKWNEINEDLRNLVYSCTTCGKCNLMCKKVSRALPLTEIIEKAREYLLVEKMAGPMPEQVSVLKNMHIRGNPWGNPPHERTKWADGLEVTFASKENKVDVLYFVGCACSYDPQGQRIARNMVKILNQARVNFGILENETCSGHEAKRMGEIGLFQYLSESNISMFKQAGVSHIVTSDPHSFYSFTHEYPEWGKGITVQHYTQFINELIKDGKLRLGSEVKKRVTYHDPCYLGRHSGVFEEPRELIGQIQGVDLVEMENAREDSNCCGMGGGRMWMEPPKGLVSSQVIAEKRIEQALDTRAEILLTACPFCNITLNDAVKSMKKEGSIKVVDITELIVMSLNAFDS